MTKTGKKNLNAIRRELIAGKMERYGLCNREVAIKLHIGESTWGVLKKDPSGLRISEMEELSAILHLDQEEYFLFLTGIEFEDAFGAKLKRLGIAGLLTKSA